MNGDLKVVQLTVGERHCPPKEVNTGQRHTDNHSYSTICSLPSLWPAGAPGEQGDTGTTTTTTRLKLKVDHNPFLLASQLIYVGIIIQW